MTVFWGVLKHSLSLLNSQSCESSVFCSGLVGNNATVHLYMAIEVAPNPRVFIETLSYKQSKAILTIFISLSETSTQI